MSMAALSFHPTATAPPLFHYGGLDDYKDVSFLQDVHPDVGDALLGFVYDPLDPVVNASLDEFLNIPLHRDDDDDDDDKQRCAKKPRAGGLEEDSWFDFTAADGTLGAQHVPPALPEFLTEFALPLPPPPQVYPPFVRGADAKRMQPAAGVNGSSQSGAARERRRRMSEKTAELSRLIPGGHKLNTAEMLQEAARHVKLLQAQVGMLALLQTIEEEKVPPMAEMHALLVCGGMQERLAAEGKCLVPTAEGAGRHHCQGQRGQVEPASEQRPHPVHRVAGRGAVASCARSRRSWLPCTAWASFFENAAVRARAAAVVVECIADP